MTRRSVRIQLREVKEREVKDRAGAWLKVETKEVRTREKDKDRRRVIE